MRASTGYTMEGMWVEMDVKGMVGAEVVGGVSRDRVRRSSKGTRHVLGTTALMFGLDLSVIMIKFGDLLNVFDR